MKMIDVLSLWAKGKIEKDTKLIVLDDYKYRYSENCNTFFNKCLNGLEDDFCLDKKFLNFEAKLIPPKEQKYRIKLPHLEFYVGFAKNKNNEKEIFPYIKDNPTHEAVIQLGIEKGLEFKTEFTEKDFEEIEELQPYKPFKELVKDDENE